MVLVYATELSGPCLLTGGACGRLLGSSWSAVWVLLAGSSCLTSGARLFWSVFASLLQIAPQLKLQTPSTAAAVVVGFTISINNPMLVLLFVIFSELNGVNK